MGLLAGVQLEHSGFELHDQGLKKYQPDRVLERPRVAFLRGSPLFPHLVEERKNRERRSRAHECHHSG